MRELSEFSPVVCSAINKYPHLILQSHSDGFLSLRFLTGYVKLRFVYERIAVCCLLVGCRCMLLKGGVALKFATGSEFVSVAVIVSPVASLNLLHAVLTATAPPTTARASGRNGVFAAGKKENEMKEVKSVREIRAKARSGLRSFLAAG